MVELCCNCLRCVTARDSVIVELTNVSRQIQQTILLSVKLLQYHTNEEEIITQHEVSVLVRTE